MRTSEFGKPEGRTADPSASLRSGRDDNSSWELYSAFPNKIVIPSVPGFPASPLSLATTYVVLPKENHMQSTEAATLDRKSGEAEGSAVRPSGFPNSGVLTQTPKSFRPKRAKWRDPHVSRSFSNRKHVRSSSRQPPAGEELCATPEPGTITPHAPLPDLSGAAAPEEPARQAHGWSIGLAQWQKRR